VELFITLLICRHKLYKDNFTSSFIAWLLSSFSFCYIANSNLVASAGCIFITTLSTCGRTYDVKGESRAEGVQNKPMSFCVGVSFMYREYAIWYRMAPRNNQDLNGCRADNLPSAENIIKVQFLQTRVYYLGNIFWRT
jgi:hypothetical protein